VPYADVLRGLKALFALGARADAASRERALSREAPGLAEAERRALLAAPADRVGVYADLVRENQAAMLDFAARATLSAVVRFCGVAKEEVARATLLDTPRRSGRTRELTARLLDHLAGRGAAWVDRCPPVLDLARLDHAQTEAFYAPDEASPLDPPLLDADAFASLLAERTVAEVLALEARAPASLRVVALDHDVFPWRDEWARTGEWPEPPPRLEAAFPAVCVRDPGTLQPAWQVVDPALPRVLGAAGGPFEPLERVAERWVEANALDPESEATAAAFFEAAHAWVRAGLLSLRAPATTPA
jgi:hypothetical protein